MFCYSSLGTAQSSGGGHGGHPCLLPSQAVCFQGHIGRPYLKTPNKSQVVAHRFNSRTPEAEEADEKAGWNTKLKLGTVTPPYSEGPFF